MTTIKKLGLGLLSLFILFGCEPVEKTDSKELAKPGTAKKAATGGDSTLIPVGSSYTKGPNTALVTIVEFSEFQCPFCSRVLPTLDKITETYKDKVRIVFKHNPLPFHKDAPLAAQAANAAGKQGKFWEMHDVLFKNMKKLKAADLNGYAKGLGLDMTKFAADLNSKENKDAVAADMALAKKVGARGTPNFFVNGEQVTGARPFPAFKTVIDKQLKAAEAALKAGTKASDVYAAMVKKNYKEPTKRPGNKRPGRDTKTVYKIPATQTYTNVSKGPEDALVTILEFSEFQCPFCSRVNPTIKKINETYKDKVRVIFKHNPLPFHKDAPLAAQAANAAGKQGKFWEMHDVLFKNMKKLKPENIDEYAKEIGLDMTKFAADLNSPENKKAVAADQALARQFGARGTPNFFINGRNLVGAQPFSAFKTIIDEEIKKAEKLVAAGTAKKDVYAKLTANGKTKAAAPKRQPRKEDTTVYKLPVSDADFFKGPADALVTIVEFSEFQCPFCSRVNPTIEKVIKKYGKDVRVVFKHNPLSFHKDAPLAAQAAIAAGKQDKFWQMHDILFKNMKKLKPDDLNGYAKEIGLDMTKFAADLNAPAVVKQVKDDQALAQTFAARGTPHFFINGRRLRGAQPFANFEKLIDEQLKIAKGLVAKGTARKDVYAAVTAKGATKGNSPARKQRPVDTKVYDVKVSPNDFFKGNKNAKITIVEFSEFQCPFCSRVNPTITKILKEYGDKVKVVFKHNPLSFHKDAPLAAQASIAAGKQGKFWEMHDILFKNQRKLKPEDINGYAKEIQLDMTKFAADLNSDATKKQVAADMAQARELKARGTPHFFVNGRRLAGAQPFPAFKALIDEMLKK
ncbi:MAG: thioredoxin domain-containing protein [Myxococcota bacterium]|nr:thioredoxin domain-containing protein [Myxococcota bacterium]